MFRVDTFLNMDLFSGRPTLLVTLAAFPKTLRKYVLSFGSPRLIPQAGLIQGLSLAYVSRDGPRTVETLGTWVCVKILGARIAVFPLSPFKPT